MFTFEKQYFDFNKLYETRYSLSLDDWDEDEEEDIKQEPIITKRKIVNETNFESFLVSLLNDVLDMNVDIKHPDDIKNNNTGYVWKQVTDENHQRHFIAYVYKREQGSKKTYEYIFYLDLNDITKELYIGNLNNYPRSYYLTITYPLIKICENYFDGPVYIGDIYVDYSYGSRDSMDNILNKIELPLKYLKNISQKVSFYWSKWNNKSYYWPTDNFKAKSFVDVPADVKLSHNFVQHFAGFKNQLYGAKVYLYYNAFESFADFEKIVNLLCEQQATVYTDFNYKFDNDTNNYKIELKHFNDKINEFLDISDKIKIQNIDKNEKAKIKLQNILPEKALQHFNSIIEKQPNSLSVYRLFKERASKDPYRKFDLPVIELILKDNGIDIEKITLDMEKDWLDKFYEFANMFIDHCKKLNIYKRMGDAVTNIFQHGRLNFRLYNDDIELTYYSPYNIDKDPNEDKKVQFDDLTDKELELIKYLFIHLRHTENEEGQTIIDKSRLNIDPDDKNAEETIHDLMYYLSYYNDRLVGENKNGGFLDQHSYNKFLLLQRFIYMFALITIDDYNNSDENHEENLQYPNFSALYNRQYTSINQETYYGTICQHTAYNLSNIRMKLNSYYQLYKFIKYIAYIIENGYNITFPFLGCYSNSAIVPRILSHYNVDFENNIEQIVKEEFNYDNKPNMETLNTTSISKMLTTIFTNLDKKIV